MGKRKVPEAADVSGSGQRAEIPRAAVTRARAIAEPRLLSISGAAFYCGMSVAQFERECPIRWRVFGKRRLWDRRAIDAWIDREFGAALSVAGGGDYDEAGTDDAIDQFNAKAANKKPRLKPQAGPQKAR